MYVCSTVAIVTQIKYGTNAMAVILDTGHIASMAQTIVTSSKYMSIIANTLLRRPNCKGVNIMLKNKFNQKGNATNRLILPLLNKTKTYRLTANIIGYKIDHTVPNTHSFGAQLGFCNNLYQLVVSIR